MASYRNTKARRAVRSAVPPLHGQEAMHGWDVGKVCRELPFQTNGRACPQWPEAQQSPWYWGQRYSNWSSSALLEGLTQSSIPGQGSGVGRAGSLVTGTCVRAWLTWAGTKLHFSELGGLLTHLPPSSITGAGTSQTVPLMVPINVPLGHRGTGHPRGAIEISLLFVSLAGVRRGWETPDLDFCRHF